MHIEIPREANQEAKGEIRDDRQRNRDRRELHISNMSNKYIRERIYSVITQNIERDGTRNGPQLRRFQETYGSGVGKVIHRRVVAAVAGSQHRRRRMMKVAGFYIRKAMDQWRLHLEPRVSPPRGRFGRGTNALRRSVFFICVFTYLYFL